MEMHRCTQLFLYCSGGERSLMCVRTAMKMEASEDEQRGLVRFFMVEGAGTRKIIHRRMSAVYGEHGMSLKV